ncbi:MAG: DNA polymerase I [Deltaproteobacteria bacterium]|uniref:DNA polymerase I n=1 Tax=Candidatus Deferrimicrobium sp. TaxID=3060586 RepID=UPI00271FAFF3|nr:DNA polymerase I [Candidatus Deferrimicrobium sp.]MCR4310722.1 DNA polymerase I [Deltaproteobacteria bacterium]MDO8739305.1 DNA polymerase I [Candidatus Deferrimicrobium sp.]
MASLYLIDGHNVLYRTFFGVPRLTAPDGTPTNVVLGVARILLKILREERPDSVVAVFDSREPTPRHALYPEYKANRLKTPEDLSSQIPVVDEMIDALGVRRLSVAGAEADDIIGTLSRRAEERGMDVVIISSDKDMYQLVSPRVKVRDGLKEHTVGEAQVEEVFGVPPAKVPDLLALAGDPSDNIPGVPGIGEKTASELIRDFGSLDAVLAHPERLKGARREKIEKGADAARLALRLVTIDRDIPIREDWSEFTPRGIDASRVVPLFRRLGFRKLLEELDLGKETPPERKGDAPGNVAWKRAGSVEAFLHALGPGNVASAGLAYDGDRETVAGIAVEGKGIHLLPADASAGAARALSARGATVYLHDGKALYRRDAGAGEDPRLFDTQVAGYLLEPEEGTPSFPKLRARYLPASLAAAEGESPEGRASERAAATLALGKLLEERLAEAALLDVFRRIDMPLLPVLHRIEEKGIRIDPGIFAELSEGLARDISAIERKVAAAAGTDFNINSPKQLAFLLFEKLGLPPVKKTKTGYSTDVEVLERLKDLHEIPSLVLEYRTVAKIRSTYVDVLPGRIDPRDGRIHTTLSQTQAATGRLSSSDPNLQNIPIRTELGRRIRGGFVPEKGNLFVGADYSQVELRLLAHLSGDAELIRRFRQGDDIHTATAAGVFGVDPSAVTPELRRRAKVINFGILYGMSPFGLSRELGIGGKEAKTYIEHYFDRYPGVKEYIDGLKIKARKDGYVLTIMGRRRTLKDIDSRNKVLREAAERMAINTPIQGSAADLIKMAMIRVDREFREAGMEARLILQVHDELIVEAPEREAAESERILKEAMEGVAKLSVPLTVSVSRGKNWGEIH